MRDAQQPGAALVELAFDDGELAPSVLERLISAAATRAELPVDRIVNALAAVDALSLASDRVIPSGSKRRFSISILPGEVCLSVDGLQDDQASKLVAAANLPELGGVLERMASSLVTEEYGTGTSLILSFN